MLYQISEEDDPVHPHSKRPEPVEDIIVRMSGEELQQELKRIVSSQSLHIIHIWGQYGVKATAEDSADDFYHALVLLEEEYSDSDGDIGRKSS